MNKKKFIQWLIEESNKRYSQFDGAYRFSKEKIIEKIAMGEFDE